jgi:hypothetical protein
MSRLAHHLDDAALIRLLDDVDDAGHADHDRSRLHLEACDRCARAARELARQDARVRAAIADVRWAEPPPLPVVGRPLGRRAGRPARRRSWQQAPWLKAAAVLLLVAAPAVALEPVRERIAALATAATGALAARGDGAGTATFGARSGAEGAAAIAPEAGAPQAGTALRFAAPALLVVEISSWQRAGELRLEPATGADAVLEVVGDAAGTVPVLWRGGVRIPNAPAAAADYRLRIPASVERVRVRLPGGSAAMDVDGAALRRVTRIPLAGG